MNVGPQSQTLRRPVIPVEEEKTNRHLCIAHQYSLVMAFSRFNKKASSTVSSSQPLPLVIANLTLRFLQFIFAVAVLGLYGTELSDARKNHTGDYSKWSYAEVVGVLSAVTCLVYVLPKVKSWWAFGWDLVLL